MTRGESLPSQRLAVGQQPAGAVYKSRDTLQKPLSLVELRQGSLVFVVLASEVLAHCAMLRTDGLFRFRLGSDKLGNARICRHLRQMQRPLAAGERFGRPR